jgi:Insertion element 4 transposase N-terminal/Transposase DDE domain
LSAHFAMLVEGPSTVPAGREGAGELLVRGTGAGVAGRVAAGPGLWEDWLADLRREGLIEELLADGVIAGAVAGAEHGHRLDRALTAEVTALCVITGALFPDQGYDMILARVFGMPGLPVKPGTVTPTGPALSKARERLGEQVMRKVFELDAARADITPGPGGTAFGLELTVFDGTTAEVCSDPVLAEEFGVPEGGTKPKIRLVAHLQAGTRRWKAAAVGGYHDGENTLADELEGSLGEGMLNLADRGFFSMDRWMRFSGTGAHLCWRVKNSARSVPFKTIRTLHDGSELVLLRESNAMLSKRRRDAGDPALPRLPDTAARLVSFTVLTRTRSGRTKTTAIRVLTTLLDPDLYPAGELAALYAERWQVETAFLHLKKTVRGPRRVLRGRSVTLVRQEAWALLLVHNMIAAIAAQAASSAGLDPGALSFTAVLSLVRSHAIADSCCKHCGKRPASANDPLAPLTTAILARPRDRTDRKRTSGRTPAERRNWRTEEATYTLTIIPSNLPKTDTCPGS